MTTPVSLLAISGSLRQASTNTAALRTAIEQTPAGVSITLHDLDEIPFYNGDLERAGIPPSVTALRDALEAADGLLIATPEYNWSVPAVLKNAIDWASRGPDSPLERLPVGLISAAGGGGGRRVLAHMHDVLAHNRAEVLDTSVTIARSRDHVSGGRVVTPTIVEQIAKLVRRLTERVRAHETAAARE